MRTRVAVVGPVAALLTALLILSALNAAAAPAGPESTAPPIITGTAQQGMTLTASSGSWTKHPTSYTYRWNRCTTSCIAVISSAKNTYLLASADVGARMTVTVTANSTSGPSAPATSAPTATVTGSSSSSTKVIAAGTSATNLPTESVWAGAQNPPYICCWNAQGQYVTFTFSVGGGSTNLGLRYSAGNGTATRKLELDGSVLVANQAFPPTASWSSWSTVTINTTLAAGTHSLKMWWDGASGSSNYINLDNLTVTQLGTQSAPSVAVALGYADTGAGLTPWAGSANTVFIGEPGQCCLTHGPDNGRPGYDAGAIEVTNTGTSAVTVNAVTVDFGGGSSPSHFDLWGGGTSGRLPLSLAPGAHLVLTMTSGFNFDTSDLLAEACQPNSGVVPVVHVVVNGVSGDYNDSHQILNSDGTDLSSCPGAVSEEVPFTTVNAGVQPSAAPVNDVLPALTGVAVEGHVLSGLPGGWNASPPPTLAAQWDRCDANGANCNAIGGATGPTYRPTTDDVGSRLRFRVVASNPSATLTKSSAPTAVVQSGPPVAQMGSTSTGISSVFVNSTTELASIATAATAGRTTDFVFFARGAGGNQTFTPKIYSVVNGAKGSLLATGTAITVPMGSNGQWYVSTLAGVALTGGAKYLLALAPSGTGNTYVGTDNETSGPLSFFVDYTP